MHDVVNTAEVVIVYAPVLKHDTAVKEALHDWICITLQWLGPSDPDILAAREIQCAVECQLLCATAVT